MPDPRTLADRLALGLSVLRPYDPVVWFEHDECHAQVQSGMFGDDGEAMDSHGWQVVAPGHFVLRPDAPNPKLDWQNIGRADDR